VDGLPQRRMDPLLRFLVKPGSGATSATVAKARPSRFIACWAGWKPLHLFDQEIRDVVGVAPGSDAIDVPSPGWRDGVEREEPVFVQRGETRVDASVLFDVAGVVTASANRGPQLSCAPGSVTPRGPNTL